MPAALPRQPLPPADDPTPAPFSPSREDTEEQSYDSRLATLDDLDPIVRRVRREQRVLRALYAAHEALDRLGVHHIFLRDLAAGIYGPVRVTTEVAFLVAPEAFATSGPLVSFRQGLPHSVEGVPIDCIRTPPEFAAALADPMIINGIPLIRVETLIYMKLVASRSQDLAEVTSLLREGDVNIARVRSLLDTTDPALRVRFEELLAEAVPHADG